MAFEGSARRRVGVRDITMRRPVCSRATVRAGGCTAHDERLVVKHDRAPHNAPGAQMRGRTVLNSLPGLAYADTSSSGSAFAGRELRPQLRVRPPG